MQRLLSGGLVIIAMHSALLFRNHYEAGIRSLTSFCLAELLVLTMGGGSEGEEGGEADSRERGAILCSLKDAEEGRSKKKGKRRRNDAQFSKIEF